MGGHKSKIRLREGVAHDRERILDTMATNRDKDKIYRISRKYSQGLYGCQRE